MSIVYYHHIVYALHKAAETSIAKIPFVSLNIYWYEELDRLKED
jgi:hypothetical protein